MFARKLVVPKNILGIESPAISERSGSEVAISLGDGEVKKEALVKGKHRLANVTLPNGSEGASLISSRHGVQTLSRNKSYPQTLFKVKISSTDLMRRPVLCM